MLFSIGIGSAGEGEPSYCLRLPFKLSPGRNLKMVDGTKGELLGRPCEIAQEHFQYVLIVPGFESEDEAALFLKKACAGLIWFGMEHSSGVAFSPDRSPINLFQEPQPISVDSLISSVVRDQGWRCFDGDYCANKTTIRPDHKRLLIYAGGQVSCSTDIPVASLCKAMTSGMSAPSPENVLSDPILRLACQMFSSSYFEVSQETSFLCRIMTLEILIPEVPLPRPMFDMVTRFIKEVSSARASELDDALNEEYGRLLSRLSHLQRQSIGSGIRRIVEAIASDLPDGEASGGDLAREMTRLYGLRSALVHKGKADAEAIVAGNGRLGEVVPLILRSLFSRASAGSVSQTG